MDEGSHQGCIFCTRRRQPVILFETPFFYLIPDKFPLFPGHVLIITKGYRFPRFMLLAFTMPQRGGL